MGKDCPLGASTLIADCKPVNKSLHYVAFVHFNKSLMATIAAELNMLVER